MNLDFLTLLNIDFGTFLNYILFIWGNFSNSKKVIYTQKRFLTHFMTQVFFYTSWKREKSKFSNGTEKNVDIKYFD